MAAPKTRVTFHLASERTLDIGDKLCPLTIIGGKPTISPDISKLKGNNNAKGSMVVLNDSVPKVHNDVLALELAHCVHQIMKYAAIAEFHGQPIHGLLKDVVTRIKIDQDLAVALNDLNITEPMPCNSAFGVLPAELRTQIFKYALTADDRHIRLRSLTTRIFRPNIAVALLRVSRSMYHEVREYLYSENIFVFDTFGTDLGILNQPLGLERCRHTGCICFAHGPYLKEAVFDIGNDLEWALGFTAATAFKQSLKAMKSNLHIGKLTIRLRKYHFYSSRELRAFAQELSKVKIGRSLSICVSERQYENPVFQADVIDLVQIMEMKPNAKTLILTENKSELISLDFKPEFDINDYPAYLIFGTSQTTDRATRSLPQVP